MWAIAQIAARSRANAELKGPPPVTIIDARIDPLRSDGVMLESALKKAGVKVDRTNGVTISKLLAPSPPQGARAGVVRLAAGLFSSLRNLIRRCEYRFRRFAAVEWRPLAPCHQPSQQASRRHP